MAVAAQENREPQDIAVAGRADDDRAAGAGFEQSDPAQDQGAHDALAELGFADQQRAQLLRRNDQRLDRLGRAGIDERGPARKLGEFAHEVAGTVRDDQRGCAALAMLRDLDVAGEDDRETAAHRACICERIARRIGAKLAETAHALDVRCFQRGKHLMAPRFDDRLCRKRRGHAYPRGFFRPECRLGAEQVHTAIEMAHGQARRARRRRGIQRLCPRPAGTRATACRRTPHEIDACIYD